MNKKQIMNGAKVMAGRMRNTFSARIICVELSCLINLHSDIEKYVYVDDGFMCVRNESILKSKVNMNLLIALQKTRKPILLYSCKFYGPIVQKCAQILGKFCSILIYGYGINTDPFNAFVNRKMCLYSTDFGITHEILPKEETESDDNMGGDDDDRTDLEILLRTCERFKDFIQVDRVYPNYEVLLPERIEKVLLLSCACTYYFGEASLYTAATIDTSADEIDQIRIITDRNLLLDPDWVYNPLSSSDYLMLINVLVG